METNTEDIQINVRELISLIQSKKYLMMAIIILVMGISGVVAFRLPNIFESSVVYMIIDEDSQSFNLAGAAALLGGGQTNQSIEKFRPILESNDLIISFIEKNNITKQLFPDLVDSTTGEWTSEAVDNGLPHMDEAVQMFRNNHLILDLELGNNLIQINMRHTEPKIALSWLNLFTESFLSHMEQIERKTSDQTLDFYRSKLQSTDNPDHKAALIKLIADETKQSILLGRNKFQLIDSAKLPRKKVAPSRLFILIFSGVAGFAISIIIILIQFLYGQVAPKAPKS